MYICVCENYECMYIYWMLLSNQIFELEYITSSGMGEGDNGCDSGLLGVCHENVGLVKILVLDHNSWSAQTERREDITSRHSDN